MPGYSNKQLAEEPVTTTMCVWLNFPEQMWVFYVYCSRQSCCHPPPDNTWIYWARHRDNSDLWATYRSIQAMWYTKLTANHTYEFVSHVTGAHAQIVKNSWKKAKLRNKKQYGTHHTILDNYLCEWMWWQRHRKNDLFDWISANILTHFPPM